MSTLFTIEPAFPEGFSYKEDFIGKEEEEELVRKILEIELHNFNFRGYTANRKVASFGYDYGFDNSILTKGKAIPSAFDFLIKKISVYTNLEVNNFAELLIAEYPAGAVINWHRDAPPFDLIAGISLLSDCTFRLRPQDKAKQTRANILSFPVKRRSIYIIEGAARTDWQHSILPVMQARYSITVRTLKK